MLETLIDLNPAFFLRAPREAKGAVRQGVTVRPRYVSNHSEGRIVEGEVLGTGNGAATVRVTHVASCIASTGKMLTCNVNDVTVPLDRIWDVDD